MSTILAFFSVFLILRLVTLFISIRNEKILKLKGAIEHGKTNSAFLTMLHILFYLAAITEAIIEKATFGTVNTIGVILFAFSYLVLLYVIYQLRGIWTVKLLIANNHKINTSLLFKYVRHPNYFLNIIPELIGIGMLCKAWYAMIAVLPFYALTLIIRIMQEEKAMQVMFKEIR